MNKSEQALQVLLDQKLLPLYYHDSAAVSVAILQALYDAGVKTVEYTNRGENALKNFKELRRTTDEKMPGMLLGIGTIKNEMQAQHYIDAGADFIVCPSMNNAVAKTVHEAELLWIPGCMTPTEIAAAENAGAALVKIFPGNILGPSYISAVKDLFPNLLFMPTGGVDAEEKNLQGWFASGVVAVGMGSKLISKELVHKEDYNTIKEETTKALKLIKQASITNR